MKGFVAYFDVLGFSELIRFEDDFSEKITTYNTILNEAVTKNDRNLDYIFFSDSVIINSREPNELDLIHISQAISEIMYELIMKLNLTICGCVSYGEFTKLSNDGNVMITGLPILNALDYEKKQNWIGTMLSPYVIKSFPNITERTSLDTRQIENNLDYFIRNMMWKYRIQRYYDIPFESSWYDGYIIVPMSPQTSTGNDFINNIARLQLKLDELSLYASDPYVQKKYSNMYKMLGEIWSRWSKINNPMYAITLIESPINEYDYAWLDNSE